MLRIIHKTIHRDTETVFETMHTLDIECAELENILHGGSGGGPDGRDFMFPQVIGVEILPPKESQ